MCTGIYLQASGNGTADVSSRLVVVFNNNWISLNIDEVGTFFKALRQFGSHELVGYSAFNDNSNDFYLGGQCTVTKADGCLSNVQFIDGEYEKSNINGMCDADIVRLLELEAPLHSCMISLVMALDDVRGAVDGIVEKYRHNAAQIQEDTNWRYEPLEMQLAWNLYSTFASIVEEFYEKNKNNRALF